MIDEIRRPHRVVVSVAVAAIAVAVPAITADTIPAAIAIPVIQPVVISILIGRIWVVAEIRRNLKRKVARRHPGPRTFPVPFLCHDGDGVWAGT